MNLDEIQTFISIAELGGFTRAADRLHRSQPAISRRVSLLEEELGAPLLERVRGGVRLTEAGRAFLPYAEAMLAAVEDGREAVQAVRREEQVRLSLAIVGTLADTHIVELLRDFARQAKGVRVDLRTATSREVSDLVRRGEVTLGLRYFPDEHPDLVSSTVGGETMRVVVSAEQPLASRPNARQLRHERWVGFPRHQGQPESFGNLLQRQLAVAGLTDVEVTPIDSLTAQKRLVEAGFGIALVPESSIREELRLGSLKVLDVPELRCEVPVAVVHRRRGFLGTAARALLSLLSDEASHLAESGLS